MKPTDDHRGNHLFHLEGLVENSRECDTVEDQILRSLTSVATPVATLLNVQHGVVLKWIRICFLALWQFSGR